MKVGYARLSKGDPDGLTLEIQLDKLKAAGCERIYSEVISGNARHRPEWERLKQAIADGEVTEVVAYRFDRLSRSWTAIGEVIDLFSRPNPPLLTLTDDTSIDLSSTSGRTVAGVLASVAAGERERIVARAKAGLRKRFASGRRIKIPFGVAKDPSGFPIVDRRPLLSTIDDHKEHSYADVALAIWSSWESDPTNYTAARFASERFGIVAFRGGSAVTWCLNPVLRGALTTGRANRQGVYDTVIESQFEPLIEPHRHRAAVAVYLASRATNNRGTNRKATPLSGKVKCSECGRSMTLHRILTRNVEASFRCRRTGCSRYNKRVRYSIILEGVRQHLLKQKQEVFDAICRVVAKPTIDKDFQKELKKAQDNVQTLRKTFIDVPMDDIRRGLEKAEARLAELQAQEVNPNASAIDPKEIMRWFPSLFGAPLPIDDHGNVLIPVPKPDADPMESVDALLKDSSFKRQEEYLIPLVLHHVVVDGEAKEVKEVVDLFG